MCIIWVPGGEKRENGANIILKYRGQNVPIFGESNKSTDLLSSVNIKQNKGK